MAFGKRLRILALHKQALAAEADVLRDTASLELAAWRGRLARLARLAAVVAPAVAAWKLLRR